MSQTHLFFQVTQNLHRSKTSCSDVKRKTTVSGVPLSSTIGAKEAYIGSSSNDISSSHVKNIRKISTPVMMQSMYADTSPSKHSSGQMRKNLAKKRLNQKYGMADGDGEDEDGADQGDKDQALAKCLRVHRSYYRRRSISLDAAVNGRNADGCWRSLESSPDSSMDSTHESKMSRSAFQRMRCRFNRWKLST
uniref:Uncharacterized protein n=1 Tax=Ditylenchus dipsaci TaxID=166011 RepID=A0A915CZW4_9BILA